jgi:hypothetical protein
MQQWKAMREQLEKEFCDATYAKLKEIHSANDGHKMYDCICGDDCPTAAKMLQEYQAFVTEQTHIYNQKVVDLYGLNLL